MMKELYTSPEAELLRFAAAESLADNGDTPVSFPDDDENDGVI